MKSHSKRILSLVFALLMLFQQVLFAAQTVDLFNPELGAKTVDLIPGEDDTNTVDLLTPSEEDNTKTVDLLNPEQPSATIEQQKPIIEKNENKTVDTITPRGDDIVPAEGKKSTTTIVVGGDEIEEGETNENSEISPEEIILPEENEKEEKKDASFEDEEHHENAGVLPWSTDLVKPWSIYRAPKTVYRPGEDLDLTELLVEIKTGRSGSLYNIEDLINDEFTTITRTRKSDGQKVRLDDKIYEDETMTIHMDGCQDLTIDFTVDENLKDEAKAFEAFQQNLIREEFRNGLDFSLYLIKKGEKENPVVAYSLDPHKLTPIGNGVDKKLKDGPLFDLKDINSWDRYDIETIGKVKAILERSAEIKDTENIRKKLITQLAIWNVTSNIIPEEIDATVSEPTEVAPELKPADETKENPEEDKKDEPIEITEPTTPEEETENIEKENEKVEDTKDETVEIKTEEKVEEKIEAEESEKIEEKAPVQSTVHKIVFNAKEIDVPYDDIELSDEEYELYKELTSLEAVELKNEDEDLKIYEPIIIEETENQYADLVTIGESDIDSIERVATEVTFDAVEYSFQNLYHTLETSSMLGFGQPRDFNVLLKATMKASRKIVEGDKFEVEILSKTLPILNGEEGRANDIQIDGKVVATAEYIAEEHKIVYTFVEDLDSDKVEIEQEFKQIKEEKPALLNMLDVSENLVLDAVRGAEGDEDSEGNPDELEISPEFEENLIQLKLGNTNVTYTGVSFETKKFRLKTTMTAKAFPIWQIPKDWTFDVNIGPYLKPDPNYPLKNLYNPDDPKEKIAEPKYNPDTNTITYKYVKSLSSTKTLDIDQYLAFNIDKIGDKDKIDINISVEPKNNPKQQMPTKTVYRDDRSPVITSAFEVEFDENGEPNLNNQYKFFEYGPSYKVTFNASANPIVKNREVTAVEWTVVFDGNGENLNSKQLDLITNFTAVKNSGLKNIEEDVKLNEQDVKLTDNDDMRDKFLINDSKYFDGHNTSNSIFTFKFKTPVDSKQKAYVLDIAAKLRGVNKTGAVRLIMPAYEGAKLEMVSPNDMTHSNRTTISGKFIAEDSAEWIVTEEVSTGDQGSLPLIERNISENQTLASLNVAYYGLGDDGKMHQIKGETRKDNHIKAGNLDGEKTFAPGTIAVYEYKTNLLKSDESQTYKLSNGAISKYRDVDVNITWSKRVENSKYPKHTVILVDKNTEISQDKIDSLTEKELENYSHVKIGKEEKYEKDPRIITKIPNVKLWNIDEKGNYTNINYKIFEQMPKKGTSDNGTPVKYGEVYKTYDSVKDIYEIQNFISEITDNTANISIIKVDEKGKELSGANFKLLGIKDIESQNESEDFAVEGTTDKDGKIDFLNIPPGLYTLQETKSPEGFEVNKKTDTITVKKDGSVKWTNNTISNVTYEKPGQITDWKSEVKYLNGSSAYPAYMNTLSYSEVDENNNFTAYIMLKPDVNPTEPGKKTDKDTRVSMFADNISNLKAEIYDVNVNSQINNRDDVKNAMKNRNADKLSLTEVNNEHNTDAPITINNYFYDEFLGKYVSSIRIPSTRFGDQNPGWAFLIKVTGKIDNPKIDGKFSYRWLTDQNTQSNVKIEDDVSIPKSNNRREAINPTFTIVNNKAKITSLNIQKLDDKNNKLTGAEFSLYDSNGQIIKTGKTQSEGILRFEELSPGDYLLKETKSLEGYYNPELNFNITIKEDGSIAYEVKDKKDNIVHPGEYYKIGEFGSEEPVEPPQKKEITVEEARIYLDQSDNYGQKWDKWEEARYESYSFTGKFLLKNCEPNDHWELDFDDNWNFTQWFGELPDIKSRDGQLIATAKLDLSTNTIRYTLADTEYVKDHNSILVEVKYNSIRPSKYYVKNSGVYQFHDIINVGTNQKVINTTVHADLGQFYGIIGDHTPRYITQNVDVYEKNGKTMMRNVALFNVTGKQNLIGDKIARIYYGTSRNDGKLFREGEKITPGFKPTEVIVYRVASPNEDNMPLSCGIRPSVEQGYTEIARYNDFSKGFNNVNKNGVRMNFDPGRLKLGANTDPSLGSKEGFQFQITMPDNSPKKEGYVIEQFYEITDKNSFKNYYTQTSMAYLAPQNNTIGFEQFKPTKNNSIGIGWNNEEPKPKNYDLTVFNKKQPGEFIVEKVSESEQDSEGNAKKLTGAEFTLYDENNKVVKRNSSNTKGIVEFKGLSAGTYTLKETVAPEGYKATDKTITVKIDKDGKVTVDGKKQDAEIPTIQVTNKPIKTKVTIVKVGEDNPEQKLSGAVFKLFDENGKEVKRDDKPYTVTTGKDGKATFKDLEPGTYTIKEIKAPEGYKTTDGAITVKIDKDGKVTFEGLDDIFKTLNDTENPTIQVTNKPNKTKVTIVKVDEEDPTKILQGAVFKLLDKDGNDILRNNQPYTVTTGTDGKATFEELEPGKTYIIQEIEAPKGYEKTNKTWKVVVGENNKVQVFELTEGDEDDKPNGVIYTIRQPEKQQIIRNSQGKVLATVYSIISKLNADNSYRLGIRIKPLQKKYYNREETLAPFYLEMNLNDFVISTDDDFGYSKSSGIVSTQMYMYERDAEELVFKIIPKDGKLGHLQPVKLFTIGPTKVEEKTNEEQHLAYIEVSNPTPQPPTPDPIIPEENDNEFSFTVTNKYRGFNVEFLKVNDAGETLNNAEFELKKYNEETGKYEDYKTQNKIKSTDGGKIYIKGLRPGEYRLYETTAPPGYNKRLGAVVQFKIDETDGHVEVYYKDKYLPIDNDNKKIVNYNSKNGKLIIKKTDSLGQPLPGAIFGLFIEDKEIYRNNMDENGKIIFENIKPGVYILKEIKAPDGYEKTKLTWTVTVYPTGYTTVKANPYKPIDTTHTPVDVGKEGKLEVKNYNFIVQDKPDSKTLKPNQKEFFEISYEIVPKDKTNPGFKEGDFFTTQYSKNIRRQGTLNTFTPDDIVVPQGVLAVASYEERKNDNEGDVVKYTFTKLVEDLSEDMKISIKESINIDRKAVPKSSNNVEFVNKIAGNEYTHKGDDGFKIDYGVYYNKTTNTSSDFVYQTFDNGTIYLSSFINKIDWSENTLNFISYAKFENFSPNKVKINLSNVKGAVIDSKSKVNVYKVPSQSSSFISQSFSSEYNNEKGLYSKPLVENQDYEVDYYDNSADLYINDPNSNAIYIIELTTAYDPSVEDAEIREDIICRQNPHCYYPLFVYSSIIIKPSKTSAYGKTSQPEILVKNYKKPDIEFQKVDGKDKTALKGAEFTLYKAYNDEKANNEIKFGMVNKDFEFVQEEKEAYKVISGDNGKLDEGKFKFEKLEDGMYAVKETKAPKDYALLTKYAFYFKVEGGKIYRVNELGKYIDSNKKDVNAENKDADSLIVNMEKDKAQENLIQIENFKVEYPSTGGVGALPFVFIGMMIMMVGAYMFIRRRDALYE